MVSFKKNCAVAFLKLIQDENDWHLLYLPYHLSNSHPGKVGAQYTIQYAQSLWKN